MFHHQFVQIARTVGVIQQVDRNIQGYLVLVVGRNTPETKPHRLNKGNRELYLHCLPSVERREHHFLLFRRIARTDS